MCPQGTHGPFKARVLSLSPSWGHQSISPPIEWSQVQSLADPLSAWETLVRLLASVTELRTPGGGDSGSLGVSGDAACSAPSPPSAVTLRGGRLAVVGAGGSVSAGRGDEQTHKTSGAS